MLKDVTDPQSSRTSDIISTVQFVPHQCNTCLL